MSRRVTIVVLGLILVVVAVGAFLVWPRGTSEVKPEAALKDFRERATSTTAHHDDEDSATKLPAPGVYTYSATGTETVKLGPLPEEQRPLPESVTAVAVAAGADCFDFTVNYFAEHTEDSRWCDTDGALSWESHQKHQKVGALSATATITCDPKVIRTPTGTPQALECSLELSGGPMAVSTQLRGGTTVGEAAELEVGGESIEAVPVTLDFDVEGTVSGKWVETIWWSDENLPVKMERNFDLSGAVRFNEQTTLSLSSLSPTG